VRLRGKILGGVVICVAVFGDMSASVLLTSLLTIPSKARGSLDICIGIAAKWRGTTGPFVYQLILLPHQ